MTELQLRVQTEGNPEEILDLDQHEIVIGRLPECTLTLALTQVSRYHTRLQRRNDQWYVEDLKSTNGTFLNEQRLRDVQLLKHGDILRIGKTSILVVLTTPETETNTQLNYRLTNPILPDDVENTDVRTILRNAEELKEQWIQGEENSTDEAQSKTVIARLKDLVEIAQKLSSAESIEGIFSLIRDVVFRELPTLERMALLTDTHGTGKLELLNASARNFPDDHPIVRNSSWISKSICQKVFQEKVALKSVDAQSDSRFQGEDSILAKGIRGVLAVPLWDKSEVVGVLYGDAHLRLEDSEPIADDDLSFFSTIGNLVAASVQRWLLSRQLQEQAHIRQKLERYHSPGVVQQLISVGALDNGRLPPKEAEISILFADIVGFTSMSEALTPSEIAELLNIFFEEMLQSVFEQGGTLDKFIGDCIMAFFGAPEPQEDHGERAIAAALGMLNRLDKLNAQGKWSKPIQLRIAVNSGKAFVGDVGSSQRLDYTVLGATVNLASRIESICPPGECVISDPTHDLITPNYQKLFSPMGEGRFKGIDRPIKVYRTYRHQARQHLMNKKTEAVKSKQST
ncbi:adenylate/guanylate cyclase domain-containing protein [[Limnothrix rosea] IAM M-220]|uniref:adenylate/guanylate cyclase domain-containing protein n=1 Tax=[Limnothrix rosea] IAM M-220 TaxID=454133 RepID=UPI000966EAC2|nr:adenylate/guanylate cyclase domain-containing protein [[Limnothrix rosea] IAM M-220]OKH17262.1 adenylate cyclase [[Limnothrix rosea] IAM M-220]